MIFRLLMVTFLLSSHLAYSQGRAPAVEDFVGIEVEKDLESPQGTEALFNFEKDLGSYSNAQLQAPRTRGDRPSAATVFGLLFVLFLPLIIWSFIMGSLKKKAESDNVSNVEVLENYRKQRDAKEDAQEQIREVS